MVSLLFSCLQPYYNDWLNPPDAKLHSERMMLKHDALDSAIVMQVHDEGSDERTESSYSCTIAGI